jgi:uncharacterized protein YlxW (UPF0749 family)
MCCCLNERVNIAVILCCLLLQAKKGGSDLSEHDSGELERATQEAGRIQKILDQFRKQLKQHQQVIQDYQARHEVCLHL